MISQTTFVDELINCRAFRELQFVVMLWMFLLNMG